MILSRFWIEINKKLKNKYNGLDPYIIKNIVIIMIMIHNFYYLYYVKVIKWIFLLIIKNKLMMVIKINKKNVLLSNDCEIIYCVRFYFDFISIGPHFVLPKISSYNQNRIKR